MSISTIDNFHSLSPYTFSCLHYGNKLSEAGAVHLWTLHCITVVLFSSEEIQ